MQVKVKRPPGTITTLLRTPGCGSGPRPAGSKRHESGRAPEPAGRPDPAGSPGRPRERGRFARFGHSRASGNPCIRRARASPPPGRRGPSASRERGRPARKRAEGPPERRPFAAVVRSARDTAPGTRAPRARDEMRTRSLASTGGGSGFVHAPPPRFGTVRPPRPGPERLGIAAARARAHPSLIRFGLRPRGRPVTPLPFAGARRSARRGPVHEAAYPSPACIRPHVGPAFLLIGAPGGPRGERILRALRLDAAHRRRSIPNGRRGGSAFRAANRHRGARPGRQHPEGPHNGGSAFRATPDWPPRRQRLPTHPPPAQASAAPSGTTPFVA